MSKCYATGDVGQEAIDAVANPSSKGRHPVDLRPIAIPGVRRAAIVATDAALFHVRKREIGVGAENKPVTDLPIVAALYTAQEAIRLGWNGVVNALKGPLVVAPSVANLAADIGTRPIVGGGRRLRDRS